MRQKLYRRNETMQFNPLLLGHYSLNWNLPLIPLPNTEETDDLLTKLERRVGYAQIAAGRGESKPTWE